jgi:hypothetical protein
VINLTNVCIQKNTSKNRGSFIGEYETPSAPIPELSTMLLLGSVLVGLAGWGKKKFRNR